MDIRIYEYLLSARILYFLSWYYWIELVYRVCICLRWIWWMRVVSRCVRVIDLLAVTWL